MGSATTRWVRIGSTQLTQLRGAATAAAVLDHSVAALAFWEGELFAATNNAASLSVFRVGTSSCQLESLLATSPLFGGIAFAGFDGRGGLRLHLIEGGVLSVVTHGYYRVDLATGNIDQTYRHSYGFLVPIAQMWALAVVVGGSVVGVPVLNLTY